MKKIFSYNEDINKNAYLNWRISKYEPINNMQILANGYMQAAIELAQTCLDDNSDKKADIIVFPMLFSVNQGIELYEKAIYWSLNILLGYKKAYPDSHRIREHWYSVKEKIKEYGFDEEAGRGENEFRYMIRVLEVYLDELYSKIMPNGNFDMAFHNMDFSRYPLNNKMEKHFYVHESVNVVVDLENFVSVFENIFNCLDRLSGYYYQLVLDKWDSEEIENDHS